MKFVVFLVLVFWLALISTPGFSQQKQLDQLFATAKTEHKNVFIYIHASWCSTCVNIEKLVLPVQSVIDSLHAFVYVSASIDETDLGSFIARKYSITNAPVFLLLSPVGELLHYRSFGYEDTTHFLEMVQDFKQEGRIKGFAGNFAIQYPAFYNTFFPHFNREADSILVARYLDKQPDLQDEVNFNIFRTMRLTPKYLKYFLVHYRSFADKYGPLYYDAIDHLYSHHINWLIQAKDSAQYHVFENAFYFRDSAEGFHPDWLKSFRYLSFLSKSGIDWSSFSKNLILWEDKYGNEQIHNFSSDVYKNCHDVEACKTMAHYLRIDLDTSSSKNQYDYFTFAVLARRGGEDQEAELAYAKALAISPDDEIKEAIKKTWIYQFP